MRGSLLDFSNDPAEMTVQNSLQFPLLWHHNERDGVLHHRRHDCLLNRLFRRRSKKTSKVRVTGLCEGNSPVTGEFPAQRASNGENVSICWRHYIRHERKYGIIPLIHRQERLKYCRHCIKHLMIHYSQGPSKLLGGHWINCTEKKQFWGCVILHQPSSINMIKQCKSVLN